MHIRRHHHRTDADRGSALIMAIVFVTVIGLVMTIALGYSATTMRATATSFVPSRAQFYAADSAMKAAVAYAQTNTTEGRYTGANQCAQKRLYGRVGGKAVESEVCPRTATSLTSGSAPGGDGVGLRTLATGSEVGLDVGGQGGLTVYGNVYANSSIAVGNSSTLNVFNGLVKAVGGCNRNVYVDGVLQASCTVATPPAVDPAFVHGIPGTLGAGSGSCSSSTKIATLQPGYWTQALLDAAIGNCNYVQLVPGYHVLNDVNWTIKYRVVGGTLNGSIVTSAVGAGCVTGTTTGTSIVLAGTSAITLSGATASLEVCGQTVAQGTNPSVRLPLYGLTAPIMGTPTSVTMTATSAGTTGSGTAWTNPSRAQSVDTTNLATATLTPSSTSQELRIAGFAANPVVPAGVTTLTVDVWASTANNRSATFSVTGRNSAGTQVCTPVANNSFPNSLSKVTVTLTCTSPVPSPITIGIVATAGAAPAQNRTLSIDGATVTFQRPTVLAAAQSGCIVQVSGCAALSTSGNANLIYLEGELYMPLAKVDVQLPNAAGAFTTRGVTVRVLKVDTPASAVNVPIIATDYGTLNDGDVTVRISIGGTVYMTCRVTLKVSSSRTIQSVDVTACTAPR